MEEMEFDHLSAIWVLASNDDQNLITYEGIRYRLHLEGVQYVKSLVKSRPELFRHGAPAQRLELWKQKILAGSQVPSWIKAISKEEERVSAIKNLTAEDVFRSQFRAGNDADRSELGVISWGLEHIERLRNTQRELRESRLKKISALYLPLISSMIALIAVISGAWFQYWNLNKQVQVKKYELSFQTKNEAYKNFMNDLWKTYASAKQKNIQAAFDYYDKLEMAYYSIEPLIPPQDQKELWDKIQGYEAFISNELMPKAVPSQLNDSIVTVHWFNHKDYFREKLKSVLAM